MTEFVRRCMRSAGVGIALAAVLLPLRQPGPVSRGDMAAFFAVGVLGAMVVDVFLRLDEGDDAE